MTRPEELEEYRLAGYELIPLHHWSWRDEHGRERGKSPLHSGWRKTRYTWADVEANAHEGRNVGVRLQEGELVIDVDPRNFPGSGPNPLEALCKDVELDPSLCPTVHTGSGGLHLYLTIPPGVPLVDSLEDYKGIEFKTVGRQVVAAGSTHPCGEPYLWDDFAPGLLDAPPAPKALLALARRPLPKAVGGGELTPEELEECLQALPVEEYQDHDEWFSIMQAAHHATAGAGRYEFIRWATGDPKYADQGWQTGRRWDSLHVKTEGPAVTIGTLFRAVRKHGGQLPGRRAADFFSPPEKGRGDPTVDDEDWPAVSFQDQALARLNRHHAAVREGGKFRIYTRGFDPVLQRSFWERSGRKDFEDYLANRYVEVPGEKGEPRQSPLGPWWIKHPDRRTCAGVVFDPEEEHPGYLNLWTGWGVEPKKGSWGRLRDLTGEVLCGGDEASFEYVLKWAAHMVQHPGSPAEVALVFRGEKGTGKGTLGRALLTIAGRHGLPVSSPLHFTGRFNNHLRDLVFLFADEAFSPTDRGSQGVLKSLVTEPLLAYEPKGVDVSLGRNLIHLLMASNEEWVVPAGLDGERRFAVFEVERCAGLTKQRFDEINREFRGEGAGALLWDLLSMDLQGWHPRDSVPKTKALAEQILRGMDQTEEWWYEMLQAGRLPGPGGEGWSNKKVVVPAETLHASFVEACGKPGGSGRHQGLTTRMGRRLRRLAPGLIKTRVRPPGEVYGVSVDQRGRAVCYEFPSLEDCRAAFEERLGVSVGWD